LNIDEENIVWKTWPGQAHAVLRAIHASRAKKRRRDFSSTDKSAFM
jgi:hypothetical protein